MTAFFIGTLALAFLWVLIQYGIVILMFVVGVAAIVIAALLALVVYLITAGVGIFTERKREVEFE